MNAGYIVVAIIVVIILLLLLFVLIYDVIQWGAIFTDSQCSTNGANNITFTTSGGTVNPVIPVTSSKFTCSQVNTLYWLNLIAAIILFILFLVLIFYAIYSYSRPAAVVVTAAPVVAPAAVKTTTTTTEQVNAAPAPVVAVAPAIAPAVPLQAVAPVYPQGNFVAPQQQYYMQPGGYPVGAYGPAGVQGVQYGPAGVQDIRYAYPQGGLAPRTPTVVNFS
jgi:uncharacterized integral membrane protein